MYKHRIMKSIKIVLKWGIRKSNISQHQWFMPVILATLETEIKRIEVQSQLGKTVCATLSQKPITKKDWWHDSRCRP
jgi:hypothetical protein